MADCNSVRYDSYFAATVCQNAMEIKTGIPHFPFPEPDRTCRRQEIKFMPGFKCRYDYIITPVTTCFDGATFNDSTMPEYNIMSAIWCAGRLAKITNKKYKVLCDNEAKSCSVKKDK